MAAIEAVIFDLGRVLVGIDLERGLLGRFAAAGGGIEALVARLHDEPALARNMRGEIDARAFHAAVAERLGPGLGFESFAAAWCDIFFRKPEMERLFSEVRARTRVGLCSDTDALHWAHLRGMLPFLGEIEKPTLSFEVGITKPAAAIFRQAAANVGAPPEKCFFTDDLPANVAGARAAGLDAELFTGADDLRLRLAERGVL